MVEEYTCDCNDCYGMESCHGDCPEDMECQGCRLAKQASMDREFDEKSALGLI